MFTRRHLQRAYENLRNTLHKIYNLKTFNLKENKFDFQLENWKYLFWNDVFYYHKFLFENLKDKGFDQHKIKNPEKIIIDNLQETMWKQLINAIQAVIYDKCLDNSYFKNQYNCKTTTILPGIIIEATFQQFLSSFDNQMNKFKILD